MTRAEIRTLMRSWLDDASGGYFDDSTCNTWINLAHRQLQMLLLQAGQNWYEKPAETLTVRGQADYVLPSDFVTEQRLEIVQSGTAENEIRQKLIEVTTNQQDFVPISLGLPNYYTIRKDRFTVYPTPDAAYTIRLYYSPLVSDLGADSDVPDVPEQFMEYVAVLAAYNGFIKDDRPPQNLTAKMAQFEMLLKQMAADRTQDAPRSVVICNDYDSGLLEYF